MIYYSYIHEKERAMEYYGQIEHQIDAKNRIRIPAAYRKQLGETYMFMAGSKGSIFVYPKAVLDEKLSAYANTTHSDLQKLEALRKLTSTIFPACEDGQGRVVLPPVLRKHAGIKQDLITSCAAGRIELWAKERYLAEVSAVSVDDALAILDF